MPLSDDEVNVYELYWGWWAAMLAVALDQCERAIHKRVAESVRTLSEYNTDSAEPQEQKV